VTEVDRCS